MATRPIITQAIPGKKIKASVYNKNFDALLDYIISTAVELNTFVQSQVNSMNNKVTNLRMIGQPIIRLNDVLQSDEIRLEGAKVLKSTYASLANIYGNTYAPPNATDTDIYLYLPNARNRAFWGDKTFGYIEAGLPNITGNFYSGNRDKSGYPSTGSFSNTGAIRGNANFVAGSETHAYQIDFDASRSNSIYGKSNTVLTNGLKFRVVTRYK